MAEPALAPHIASPLGPYKGAKPPAPAWFERAIADAPERGFVEANGAQIEMLTWGERGRPGLILVHGASANADWWSFIAPQLANDYRVVAISLSGMGRSDWRDSYSFDDFNAEMDAAATAAGLHEAAQRPVYIGHSFGGAAVYYAAVSHPQRMRAAILVDSGFGGRSRQPASDDVGPPSPNVPNRVYPTLEAALARFRFMPAQPTENPFIVDWIARHSLKETTGPDGAPGWTWRFDPNLFPKLDRSSLMQAQGKTPGPIAHIHGDRSNVMERNAGGRAVLGESVPFIAIPDSDHHVMVDQPLALVAALRSVLRLWPTPGS